MKKLGIDMGSSTLKLALLDEGKVVFTWQEAHKGKPMEALKKGIALLPEGTFGVCLTGDLRPGRPAPATCKADSTAVVFDSVAKADAPEQGSQTSCLAYLDQIPAMTEGARLLAPQARSIVGIGSQGSCYITDFTGKAPAFSTNEHCAGGTGSFFEDQVNRLGLSIQDYSALTDQATSIPRLSGRCSVFAKTDIIHRQQEGVSIPDILLGLCFAMVRNYKAVIMRGLPLQKPLVFCGGVTANSGVVRALREVLDLKEEELVIPELALYLQACGAATAASGTWDKNSLQAALDATSFASQNRDQKLAPLRLPQELFTQDPARTESLPASGVSLGIDIGSTSTDLVLLGADGSLVDFWYLRTAGNPEAAVRKGLSLIKEKYGEIAFRSVGVTGSGRERMGRMLGADVIRDEITAQAKGACYWVPEADTVFEIGGQDSKFISIKDGNVVDFQMNKICAAGTGSFVEEQAQRMNIPIRDFGQMALTSSSPAPLGERCTVFMETAISSSIAQGTPTQDIAAGLCIAIISNYLHKVVGSKTVGQHIVLQGGVAYNPGIVAAFRQAYGDRIQVSPCFSISGAFGVALLAEEAAVAQGNATPLSSFKGFDFASREVLPDALSPQVRANIDFYHKAGQLLLEGYTGKLDPRKKTVGVPYVLMIHKFFPMAHAFFTSLGYNVLLTKPTDEETIALSQQLAQNETCYPVKLIYGHMQQLIDAGVDYIFLPTIHTMKHAKSHVAHNYGCVYMQTAPVSIAKAMGLEEKGITLLSPVFDLDFGKQAMAGSMVGLGKILGKPAPLCAKALLSGSMAVKKHGDAVEALGQQLLSTIQPEDKVLVLITRNYGVSDPILNMGIPELLLERGYKVITLSHLPAHDLDISQDYPNLYWPFGQHIISGAKLIAHHPNLYAVYLTNHGCGPDSMLSHLFKEEMGDKPYLQIEVDEHFSKVGVITRIEAFLNSIQNRSASLAPDFDLQAISHLDTTIHLRADASREIVLPDFGVYTSYLAAALEAYGYKTRMLPKLNDQTLALGRTGTSAKEYLPFAAYLGQILQDLSAHSSKKEASPDAIGKKIQYLVPATRGTEADGLYAQAIQCQLSSMPMGKQADLFAPIIESLPDTGFFDLFCRAMICGDLASAIPVAGRDRLAPDHLLTWEEAYELASQIANEGTGSHPIGLVGDPMMVFALNEGIPALLEKEGKSLFFAPMMEYFWVLWSLQDQAEEWGKKLADLKEKMIRLGKALGQRSSYSPDPDGLLTLANQHFAHFDGGNGRYRFAKVLDLGKDMSAMLHLCPRYENTATVLELRNLSRLCPCPYDLLQLDGDWEESAQNRLESFLYYCK